MKDFFMYKNKEEGCLKRAHLTKNILRGFFKIFLRVFCKYVSTWGRTNTS